MRSHDHVCCSLKLSFDVILPHVLGDVAQEGRGSLVSVDPGVREDLLGVESLLGVDHEDLLDQVLGRLGHVVPEGGGEIKCTRFNHLKQLLVAFLVKGRETTEPVFDKKIQHLQNIQNDADTPVIHLLPVPFPCNDLRCHVPGSSASSCRELSLNESRQAKIRYLKRCPAVSRAV